MPFALEAYAVAGAARMGWPTSDCRRVCLVSHCRGNHRSSPIQGESMKSIRAFAIASLALAAFNVTAGQVPSGNWQQTSSTAGDCADCEITVTRTTPQIIQFVSNNGWQGYAYYSAKDDAYKGAFQFDAGQGYDNVVFLVEARYEGKTLSFDAKSVPLSYTATYRKR